MATSTDHITKPEEQVRCPVCLDVLSQPKTLACTHTFCTDCIDHLPVDGDNAIRCLTCHQPTTLPQDGSAASLHPAALANTLTEPYRSAADIRDTTLSKPHDKSNADQDPVIPDNDTITRSDAKDECPEHSQPIDMYCKDCVKLVCTECTHIDHRDHSCAYTSDVFPGYQQEVDTHLQTVKQQARTVSDTLHRLEIQEKEIEQHSESVKEEIDALIREAIQAIRQSGDWLKENVDRLVKQKLTSISLQKEEGDSYLSDLSDCEQYVSDKLHNGSQQEIVLEKNDLIKRLEEASHVVSLKELLPKEKMDIVFQANHNLKERCSKIGVVMQEEGIYSGTYRHLRNHSDTAVAVAKMSRKLNIVISSSRSLTSFNCYIEPEKGGACVRGKIKNLCKDSYCISFLPAESGTHLIKVHSGGLDISCRPHKIKVLSSLKSACQQVRTIHGVKTIQGVGVTKGNELVMVESDAVALSRCGNLMHLPLGPGLTGMCLTPQDDIIVVSKGPPHIARYTMDYVLVGRGGSMTVPFAAPHGVAATDSFVFVADASKDMVQVFDATNLHLSHVIGGKKGTKAGFFDQPWGVAVDSEGVVYVCDSNNYRIQKFSASGNYLGSFRTLSRPRSIAIDFKDLIYVTHGDDFSVYDTQGEYMGSAGVGGGNNGIAIGRDGHIYLCNDVTGSVVVFAGLYNS